MGMSENAEVKLRRKRPQKVKLNQIRNVQFEELCIANMPLYGLGAVFGAMGIGVVSETDV